MLCRWHRGTQNRLHRAGDRIRRGVRLESADRLLERLQRRCGSELRVGSPRSNQTADVDRRRLRVSAPGFRGRCVGLSGACQIKRLTESFCRSKARRLAAARTGLKKSDRKKERSHVARAIVSYASLVLGPSFLVRSWSLVRPGSFVLGPGPSSVRGPRSAAPRLTRFARGLPTSEHPRDALNRRNCNVSLSRVAEIPRLMLKDNEASSICLDNSRSSTHCGRFSTGADPVTLLFRSLPDVQILESIHAHAAMRGRVECQDQGPRPRTKDEGPGTDQGLRTDQERRTED